MILYNPEVSLTEYKTALIELQKEYKKYKRLSIISKIAVFLIIIAILIVLCFLISSLSDSFPKWLYIPIIIAGVFFFSSFNISVKTKNTAFSNFLNADYNGILRDIRHDIRTVSYYVSCLEDGKIPDSTYAYVSVE